MSNKADKSLSWYLYIIKRFFFLIFAMSHHRPNLWYSSVKMLKKSSKRIDEVSDPLYFLKDQISHYINICIYFSKKVFLQKKHCLLPVCQLPIYIHTHTHICIYIYIYIYTQTHTHTCTHKKARHITMTSTIFCIFKMCDVNKHPK